MSIFGLIYLAAVLLVALYGGNSLLLAALYLRRRSHPPARPPELQSWPAVTVQLPIYDELYVVKRLMAAVAHLDYPRHLLQVQVLDDSNDETTGLARACVAHYRAQGLDVELIHRRQRRGFKAGALAHGLKHARGEYIAIFDADFCPPPGFLRQTVPYLVADSGLAFVQARWSYLNPLYSSLTRAQTIALDGHFVVEHLGRNRNGLLINFNGTAGVWRRRAIEHAGGWQSDTLTEDVDLSFRAQLAGWRALYLPHVEAPAELPPQVAAFKRQQARWASGAAQCLFKLGSSLWRGSLSPASAAQSGGRQEGPLPTPSRLPWPARLEALLHLSVWIAHPMSLVLLLLTAPMLLGQIPLTVDLSVFWFMSSGAILAYALSQRHLYGNWKTRMCYMPVLALVGTGLALSNTLAIAKGLLGGDRSFRRTPKFCIEHRRDRWAGSRYALPFEWLVLGELAVAAYAAMTVALALVVQSYFALPFLLLYVASYGYLGLHGLRDAWAARQARPRANQRAMVANSRAK